MQTHQPSYRGLLHTLQVFTFLAFVLAWFYPLFAWVFTAPLVLAVIWGLERTYKKIGLENIRAHLLFLAIAVPSIITLCIVRIGYSIASFF